MEIIDGLGRRFSRIMGLRGVGVRGQGYPRAWGFNQDVLCLGTNFSSSADESGALGKSLGNAQGAGEALFP